MNITQLDYYKLNPKNITHAASMPGIERERQSERAREGERLRSIKKKAKAQYHCSTGEDTIFNLLEAPHKKKKQRKPFIVVQ